MRSRGMKCTTPESPRQLERRPRNCNNLLHNSRQKLLEDPLLKLRSGHNNVISSRSLISMTFSTPCVASSRLLLHERQDAAIEVVELCFHIAAYSFAKTACCSLRWLSPLHDGDHAPGCPSTATDPTTRTSHPSLARNHVSLPCEGALECAMTDDLFQAP